MPFVPVPNVANVQLIMDYGGQTVENNLNFEKSSQPGAADLQSLVAICEAWRVAHLRQLAATQLAYVKWVAADLTQQNGVGIEVPITVSIQGTDASGHPTPGNVAVAVKFSTGLRGRSYRGRVYMTGITSGQVQDGTVGAAFQQAAINAYTALFADASAQGWTPVVVSRYHGVDANGKPIPRATGIATPILNVTCDANSDSQRRRLPGRGR